MSKFDDVANIYWPLEPALSPLALSKLADIIGYWLVSVDDCREHMGDARAANELQNLENEIRNWLQHREYDSRMAAQQEVELDELLR